jgi:hypothetical protein
MGKSGGVMPPCIGDLCVNGANAALVSCALRDSKGGFVLSVMAKRGDWRAVAASGERLEPKVYADLAPAGR